MYLLLPFKILKKVSEETNEPIPRKLTDRRKDRHFIGPFRARLGFQKNI